MSLIGCRARAAAIHRDRDAGGEACEFSVNAYLGERREVQMIVYQARAYQTPGRVDGLTELTLFRDINDFSIVDAYISL